MNKVNLINQLEKKYSKTAYFYDMLDFPWEFLFYRKWRKQLLADISGKVLELGVGTGRNLPYYNRSYKNLEITAVDLSQAMLNIARKRAFRLDLNINFVKADAANLSILPNQYFDWVISTFLFCVLPNELQGAAISEFTRLLKPGGQFKIIEIVYSSNLKIRRKQERIARYVEKIFGARFDRNTLSELEKNTNIVINRTSFLRDDTYLLIEGSKIG